MRPLLFRFRQFNPASARSRAHVGTERNTSTSMFLARLMHLSFGSDASREGGGHVRGAALGAGHLARFIKDAKGVAALEFAFLVPVLLLLFAGTVEVSRAVSMDRRFEQVTAMIADLIAREDAITSNDMEAIYDIVEQVMSPFDASSLKISVVPVKASATDAAKTFVYPETTNRPSRQGGTLYAKCAAYPVASGLLAKNSSVIVVEATYSYSPLFVGYLFGASTWTSKALASPRNGCVDFDGNVCALSCS